MGCFPPPPPLFFPPLGDEATPSATSFSGAVAGCVSRFLLTCALRVTSSHFKVHCGLDDYYQACGTGANGSFHNASGYPMINHTKFPDMRAMTDHAHSIGLKMGWYVWSTLHPPPP